MSDEQKKDIESLSRDFDAMASRVTDASLTFARMRAYLLALSMQAYGIQRFILETKSAPPGTLGARVESLYLYVTALHAVCQDLEDWARSEETRLFINPQNAALAKPVIH